MWGIRGATERAALVLLAWFAVAGVGALGEPALVVGVVGAAVLCAWGLAAHLSAAAATPAGAGPTIAMSARHRTLAGRATPRQRDPDAAGHTRSRAPSDGTPAG